MSRQATHLANGATRRHFGAEARNGRRGRKVTKPARGKSNPNKMKRFAQLAERPCAPPAQAAPWSQWESLPGVALLAYAIVWFALLAAFINA